MTKMAKQIGAAEAYSYLTDARKMQSSSESYGADLTTALVRNYATERYGDESPENIRRTINDFNHFLTQQGSQGVNNMHDIVNGFVSGKGYGWGNTASEVNNTIDSTSQHIRNNRSNMGDVEHAAGTASSRTSDISQGSFSIPNSNAPLGEPNGGAVFPDAQSLRSYNRNEEAGISSSRIKTTPTDMIKEGVGNVFHGQGLVDSQTTSATSEGFFDKPPELVKGENTPEPGPISEGATSTLGKR